MMKCECDVQNYLLGCTYFTRQYIPEDNSEHHTRRRENLKSLKCECVRLKFALIFKTYAEGTSPMFHTEVTCSILHFSHYSFNFKELQSILVLGSRQLRYTILGCRQRKKFENHWDRRSQWLRGLKLRSLGPWDRGFESRLRHGCLSCLYVLCYRVLVEALRSAHSPFKESYQLSKRFIISESNSELEQVIRLSSYSWRKELTTYIFGNLPMKWYYP
jgi:hypothetical protein